MANASSLSPIAADFAGPLFVEADGVSASGRLQIGAAGREVLAAATPAAVLAVLDQPAATANFTCRLSSDVPAAVGTGVDRLVVLEDVTLTNWRTDFGNTAPTGAALIFDLYVNGVSIFAPGSRPSVPAGSTSGLTGTAFVTTALVAGDVITLGVTQIGSTVPGTGCVLYLTGVK